MGLDKRVREQCPILRKFALVFSLPTMKQGEREENGCGSISNSAQTAAAFCKYTRGPTRLGLYSLRRNVELAVVLALGLINAGHPS